MNLPSRSLTRGDRHSLPWRREALFLIFVAHHPWNTKKRETDPSYGMPADVEEALRPLSN
ncbi:hypothetical protein J2W42_003983 [Rhizobium tibeticum]|uniref:hypothetical protein n=1 Tax=Rhizobium tibeticum TaxID=501024 RepID=UPI00278B3F98|nr:hypothetical protein [Rhizobium tibeticum]